MYARRVTSAEPFNSLSVRIRQGAQPGVIMPLPTDQAVLLTTDEAAEHLGVKPVTIRQWVRRGHLKPAGRMPAGGPSVYRIEDLVAADEKTREKAGRPSQAERAIKRLRRAAA